MPIARALCFGMRFCLLLKKCLVDCETHLKPTSIKCLSGCLSILGFENLYKHWWSDDYQESCKQQVYIPSRVSSIRYEREEIDQSSGCWEWVLFGICKCKKPKPVLLSLLLPVRSLKHVLLSLLLQPDHGRHYFQSEKGGWLCTFNDVISNRCYDAMQTSQFNLHSFTACNTFSTQFAAQDNCLVNFFFI